MIKSFAADVYRKLRHLGRVACGRLRFVLRGRRLAAMPGKWVVLLSLGRQGPSHNVAQALAQQGFRILVLCPEFPALEAPHVHGWRRVGGLNDADRVADFEVLVAELKRLAPTAVLLEGKNLLLSTQTRLAEALGLCAIGDRPSLASNSKIAMREALDTADGPKLPWQEVRDVHAPIIIALPAIYKPDMGTASKGVRLITSAEDLQCEDQHDGTLANDISVGKRRLLESFIQGRQFDMEGIAMDGRYELLACVEEYYEGKAPYFPPSWHYFNPPISADLAQALQDAMARSLSALGVRHGAFHMEMRVDTQGNIYPLDYANRMGYNQLVSEASGVSFAGAYVRAMTGTLQKIARRPRPMVNLFCQDQQQLDLARAFRQKYPENVFRFSPAPSQIGHTRIFGRITVMDDSDTAMVAKLQETGLMPAQFATYYPKLIA